MSGEGTSQALQVRAQRTSIDVGKHGESKENRRFTRMERKVLDIIMDPTLRNEKHQDLVRASGCSDSRYRTIMADPWFQEQRRALLHAHVTQRAARFVEAAAITAETPGRDGFQDRRLLLTMSGDHVERRQHDLQVTGSIVVGVVGVSMDDLG